MCLKSCGRAAALVILVLAAFGVACAQGTAPVAIPTPGATPAALLPVVAVSNVNPTVITLANPTAYVSSLDVDPTSQQVGMFIYTTQGYTSYAGHACFDFINHGPRPITKATFDFSAATADGNIVNVGSASASGSFAVDDETMTGLTRSQVCLEYATSTRPVIGRFLVNVRAGRLLVGAPISEILVSAKQVSYDDGSTWQAQQTPQVGDHITIASVPSPNRALPGWPIVRVEPVAAAPFNVDAFTHVPQHGVFLHSPVPQFGVCVAFDAGNDAKQKQAQVAVVYIADDGTVVAVDNITMHGGRYYSECRSSAGAIKDGTFIYNVRRGAPSTAIARVIVTPLSEEFADGAMWTNPAVPTVGAHAAE
jgi:hypothetical protein